MPESRAKSAWKGIAACGAGLIVLGLGAIGLDLAVPSLWNTFLLVKHIGVVILAIVIGVLSLSIGLIGWAVMIEPSGRARLASFALAFPVAVVLTGYLLARGDMHGSFPLFLLPMAPLLVVALILGIMAASARRDAGVSVAEDYRGKKC
jgi:hypothetical protein